MPIHRQMNPPSYLDIIVLKAALDQIDTNTQIEPDDLIEIRYLDNTGNSGSMRVKPNEVVRKGIEDLDFDWFYFLGTGETSKDGWAKKK